MSKLVLHFFENKKKYHTHPNLKIEKKNSNMNMGKGKQYEKYISCIYILANLSWDLIIVNKHNLSIFKEIVYLRLINGSNISQDHKIF